MNHTQSRSLSPARLNALAAAVAISAAALSGCSTTAAGRPEIVVTTNILGDVVDELVADQGDEITVRTLMRPDADPHSFEISAQDAAAMESAELVVSNGLGLEEGLEQHLESAAEAGAPRIVATDFVDVLPYASEDARGDDPHFWTDPTQMTSAVAGIRDAIAEHVDGIDSDVLDRSADAYLAELGALDAGLAAAFDELGPERRMLVTNHHVFGYLAKRYDFRIVGAIIPGGATLAAPSASDLDDLATAIRDSGVPAIFADSSQPDRLAQVLADEAGVDVTVTPLFTESLTAPGGGAETYLQLMTENGDRLLGALKEGDHNRD